MSLSPVFLERCSNTYPDVLPSIREKYNISVQRTIKMTPKEASQKTNKGLVYFCSLKDKKTRIAPKFNPNDQVRISEYKKKFEKGYTPNWTEEIFEVHKVNMTNPVTYNLKYLKNEKHIGFYLPARTGTC